MSDGPHRSLLMRRAWKKVAEYADKQAFSLEEVAEAVSAALDRDWRADVSETLIKRIRDILLKGRNDLFPERGALQLEELRPLTAGHDLAQILLDGAIMHAAHGESGIEAAASAAEDVLIEWAARHGRQIEEHYRRKSTARRAEDIRERIEGGILAISCDSLARHLLGVADSQKALKLRKQTGLDDGVKI